LDLTCGIGTQAIGFAQQGFSVTASDLSANAVKRAKSEAKLRNVSIRFTVCDILDAAGYSVGRQTSDLKLSGVVFRAGFLGEA
jgi:2-polyprenyl-3-methyl-5-hydroxy-6-metoxy-1,4-benzoquinol methylase